MSRSADIELPFGTDVHRFRLGIGQWRRVQERCDAGPPEIAQRLAAMVVAPRGLAPLQLAAAGGLGRWRIDDVREVILQGLIGAGMVEESAGALVRTFVDQRPLTENVPTALSVVMASLIGAADEDPRKGEPEGEATTQTASPVES